MNMFTTVLTYPAPSANYRGESEANRSVIQKVTFGRFEYPIISPEAMRNALREILALYGLPTNRERLHNEDQLAVKFKDYPDADKYVDDFFFGYLMALSSADRKKVLELRGQEYQVKRDSILRMNLAMSLEPYRHDAVFTQSPKSVDSPWQNAGTSALLHRETAVTAYQYPFAINLNDCGLDDTKAGSARKEWLKQLLKAISELNGVAGNHARSYYEMAPASIIVRFTESLVAGYDTYGFTSEGSFPEVMDGIENDDYPGSEFYLGGLIVRKMNDAEKKKLEAKGVNVFRTARQTLDAVARVACGDGFISKERS